MRRGILIALLLAFSANAQDAGSWWGAVLASSATSNAFPSSGLIAYWGMRTSGTNVLAEIGSVNGGSSGCLFGSEYGVSGPGAYFDGLNDFINVTGVASTNQWTFAAWIKPLEATNPKVFDSAVGRIILEFVNSPTLDGWRVFDGQPRISGVTTLYTNQWSHWVVSQAATAITFYRNGVQVGAATGAGNSIGGVAALGSRFSLDQTFYKGSMDEVAIWERAISSNEAVRIYNENLVYP